MNLQAQSKRVVWLVLAMVLLFSSVAAAQGRLTGYVVDSVEGNYLPGANVMVTSDARSLGAATNLQGYFIIPSIPAGKYTLVVRYMGYTEFRKEIEILPNEDLHEFIELSHEALRGEAVYITAQAAGQLHAIQQQLSAASVKNIVAADRIQELPEATAAEALGRLPGIAIERTGGEGNRVAIRGLNPRYANIQIEGVSMAATGSWDRSTELRQISPFMLESIEVFKSAMADQEANQVGGTVNFRVREAGDRPFFSLILQGGYNGLREELGNYKIVGMGSRRFFSNRLGVYANIDFENVDRSSNSVGAGYGWRQTDGIYTPASFNINDNSRENTRYGATLVMDYTTLASKIKFTNIYNRIDNLNIGRRVAVDGTSFTSSMNHAESVMSTMVNALEIAHHIRGVKLTLGAAHSWSENETPVRYGFGGRLASPFRQSLPYTIMPDDVMSYVREDLSGFRVDNFSLTDTYLQEREFSQNFSVEFERQLARGINLKLKTGGLFKQKSREYDLNEQNYNVYYGKQRAQNLLIEHYPIIGAYITAEHAHGHIPYAPFIDHNYNPGDFMAGNYTLQHIPDVEFAKEITRFLRTNIGSYEWGDGRQDPERFAWHYVNSLSDDYDGTENYSAFYILPQFSFGRNEQVTFIPGFRYERNTTTYTGTRGKLTGNVHALTGYPHHFKTHTRNNEFFLPMFHLKVKPAEWYDVRISYTKTLSRPSYGTLIPSWNLPDAGTSISLNNYQLEPEQATNLDIYFSAYGSKGGLFSVGVFNKEITDWISWRQIYLIELDDVLRWGLTEEETGSNPQSFVGMSIWPAFNSDHDARIWGIEAEWQSNFWFLPGLLSNIVLNINYTRIFSETTYSRMVPITEWVQINPLIRVQRVVGQVDSVYKERLTGQPDHLINVTLGYDYKGFSIRGSMQHTAEIFASTSWRWQNRAYTDPITLFDLSLKQTLPVQGMEMFCNFNNITRTISRNYIAQSKDYFTGKSFYGMTGSLGIRYRF